MRTQLHRTLISLALVLTPAIAAAQANLLADVRAARALYPTPMSAAQLGELLDRVAWQHRDDGWGLLAKPGGNNCPTPQGVQVACDILFHKPSGTHFDVLVDAGGSGVPAWQADGPMDVSRWVAPVDPGGSAPPPVLNPPPAPDLTARLSALEARVNVLESQLAQLRGQVAALPPAQPSSGVSVADVQNLIEDAFRRALVSGKTGQTAYHQHNVGLRITLEPAR